MAGRRFILRIVSFTSPELLWISVFFQLTSMTVSLKFGDQCHPTDPSSCIDPSLTCAANSTCTCSPDYFRNDNNPKQIECVIKSSYGEVCTAGNFNPCKESSTVCREDVQGVNRCLCYRNYFRNTGVCTSVDELAVDKIIVSTSTSTVSLSWTADKHGQSVVYTVGCNQGDGQLMGSVSDSGAVWSGLTPGRKYSFNISVTLSADSFYSSMFVIRTKSDVWMKSAQPGIVTSVTLISGHTGAGYRYDIEFQPSDGDVALYTVSINHETMTTAATTATFSTLGPGGSYNYSITAHNGIHEASQATTGSFRINVTDVGQVRGLKVIQDSAVAQELKITFMCPDEKALGNVQGYRINKTLIGGQQPEHTSFPFLSSTTSCQQSFSSKDVGGILVEKNYTFSVRAWNEAFVGNFSPEVHLFVEPKIPRLQEMYGLEKLMNKAEDNSNDKSKIPVNLCASCLLDSSQGPVTDIGIVICVLHSGASCTVPSLKSVDTWKQSKKSFFTLPYRTTSHDWKQFIASQPQSTLYTIGVDATCSSASETTYCNGPLPKEKELVLILFQCNSAGCEQIRYDGVFNTREEPVAGSLELGLGLGLGLGIPAIGVVVVVIVILKCRTRSNYDKPDQKHDDDDNHGYTTFNKSGLTRNESQNPRPHRPESKPPEDYIDPENGIPQYFTTLGSLGGSTHDYSHPDDSIYDVISEDNEAFDGGSDYVAPQANGTRGPSHNQVNAPAPHSRNSQPGQHSYL